MNERIRALRHTLQLSQKEFARQIGADYYLKDAAESARVAGLVLGR